MSKNYDHSIVDSEMVDSSINIATMESTKDKSPTLHITLPPTAKFNVRSRPSSGDGELCNRSYERPSAAFCFLPFNAGIASSSSNPAVFGPNSNLHDSTRRVIGIMDSDRSVQNQQKHENGTRKVQNELVNSSSHFCRTQFKTTVSERQFLLNQPKATSLPSVPINNVNVMSLQIRNQASEPSNAKFLFMPETSQSSYVPDMMQEVDMGNEEPKSFVKPESYYRNVGTKIVREKLHFLKRLVNRRSLNRRISRRRNRKLGEIELELDQILLVIHDLMNILKSFLGPKLTLPHAKEQN